VASSDIRVKDPRLVAAGKKAMLSRWGPPKTAHLDDFTPDERAFLHAMIDAARNAKAASAVDPEAALPEVHCHARPAA
jgi:hypothetical protein